MADNGLDLCNEALVRIGTKPLGSFADMTAQGMAAASIYRRVKRSLLADHPWSFTIRECNPAEILPSSRRILYGKHVYQLPPDVLRVIGLRSKDYYELSADQLYTDQPPCTVNTLYVANVDESFFKPWFEELLVAELCVAFATSVTDNPDRAKIYESRLNNNMKARARSIDSQQMPPAVYDLMKIYVQWSNNPLVAA
jgi:hypothetical protein